MKRTIILIFLLSIELNIGISEIIKIKKPNSFIKYQSTIQRLKKQCNIPDSIEFNKQNVTKYSSNILNRIDELNANIRIRHRNGKKLLRNSI